MEATPLWFLPTLLVSPQLPLGGHSSDPLVLADLVEWKLSLDTGGYRFCDRSPTFSTMASCVPQRRADTVFSHMVYYALTSLHLQAAI